VLGKETRGCTLTNPSYGNDEDSDEDVSGTDEDEEGGERHGQGLSETDEEEEGEKVDDQMNIE